MGISAVGTLFPAIPLAIVALNFRYTSLAGLMRNISSQLAEAGQGTKAETILIEELKVMRSRMMLVKYSLFFGGLSFIFNLVTLFTSLQFNEALSLIFMNVTITLMVLSLACFCVETVLSTKALNLHLSGLRPECID